jgi:predicted secreted acid phosphatase
MIILHTDLINLDTVKSELVQYHDSGKYSQQIATVDKEAQKYLALRINQNKNLPQPKKLAIVFDIDETALSNYPNMVKRDFSHIHAGQITDDAPVIQPTLGLFQFAEKNNVAVFFVTGRNENLRPITVKNLDKAGYFAYDGLYMRPDNYKNKSIIPFIRHTKTN